MNRKGVILLTIVLAALVFSVTLVHAVLYAPDDSGLPAATSTAQTIAALTQASATTTEPVRLVIPSLSVDAKVQYVGVNSLGNMGTPNNFTDVAWYEYGPEPGQTGSAVIDGHVDNGLSLPGVFKNLKNIQVGDSIYVQEKDGSQLHFVVSDIELYPYKAVPTDLLFNQTDQPRLNLVTCDGTFISNERTYDQRLVVYSTLQQS